ncbi:urea amidolyase associated protein UAAP2 [Demequina soli]|uniref:urea amidolyase associated protein UAAP2 n=1 Tax=Demequina soli TaxID=1638987 RepID=UPI0007838B60|nr:urea amidolyase associated protein UAAP2 [Demequina soli]
MTVTWATHEADYFDRSEPLVAGVVVDDHEIAPREGWSLVVRAGRVLTLVDVGGNQSGDCLIYDAADRDVRYSVQATLAAQRNAYLVDGAVLRDQEGHPLMTIVGNEVDRQDTIGGACSKESNTLRYGHHTLFHHACRENFLLEGARHGLGPRDLVSNINWFMNVPVEPDGTLGIVDGMSGPGRRVALRAERDVLVVLSNCPQVNNPCNDFNPTPLRVVVTDPAVAA